MKLTLKQLNDSFGALQELTSQKITPGKFSYKLSKILKAATEEMEPVRKEIERLLEEYGATDLMINDQPTGQKIIRDPVQRKEFNSASDMFLRSSQIEIFEGQVWGEPIALEDIEKFKLQISPADLAALDWLISDSEFPASIPSEQKVDR